MSSPMQELARVGHKPHPVDRRKYGQPYMALYWATSGRFARPGLYVWLFSRQVRLLPWPRWRPFSSRRIDMLTRELASSEQLAAARRDLETAHADLRRLIEAGRDVAEGDRRYRESNRRWPTQDDLNSRIICWGNAVRDVEKRMRKREATP